MTLQIVVFKKANGGGHSLRFTIDAEEGIFIHLPTCGASSVTH